MIDQLKTDVSKWRGWVADANRALVSLCDQDAKWWTLEPRRGELKLTIGDQLDRNLAILLLGCRYFVGPVDWTRQSIQVSFDPRGGDRRQWRFILQDTTVGFWAKGRSFHWRKNIDECQPDDWRFWEPE